MTIYRQAPISCPRCGIALTAVPTPKITRHTCGDCGGVWLEEEDLRRLLEELAIDPLAPLGPLEHEAGPLRCPRCRKPMAVERTHGAEPTAMIDVCPEHGVWFDRDEMALALERLQLGHLARERGPYHDVPDEVLIFVWIYRQLRRETPEPPRTRGRPA